MSLVARERMIETEHGSERRLFVACPQRIDAVAVGDCARCELCEGLDLDGVVAVRCAVEPPGHVEGAPPANAAVAALMTSPVVCVDHDASIENVQWLLLDRNIGAVPVLGDDGRTLGILAKTDLLRDRDEPAGGALVALARADVEPSLSERSPSGLRARDLMTPVVHAVLEETTIAAAAARMARERVHHLLVVDQAGDTIGILSSLDLVRWIAARERFTEREAVPAARRPR